MNPSSPRHSWIGYLMFGVLSVAALLAARTELPRSVQAPAAFGPGSPPAPAAAAAFPDRPTTIERQRVAPDRPVRVNALPPIAAQALVIAGGDAEGRIESELTEAEYEAAVERSLDLPAAPESAAAISALATGPGLGTGFVGPDIALCCGGGTMYVWPPDPVLAAGPNHLLAAVNIAFGVYNKAGARQGNAISAYAFWAGTTCGTIATGTGGSLFDPFTGYDPAADRFMVGYVARSLVSAGASANQSYLCVAVSQTGDPTGAWYRYSFDVSADVAGTGYWMDFPQAAVWRDGLYVAGNYFNFAGGGSQFARVYGFDKADLYAGATTDVVLVDAPQDRWGFNVFTVQPVRPGAAFSATSPATFAAFQNLNCGTPCPELNAFTLTPNFSGGSAAWARIASLNVTGVSAPVSVPQAGSAETIQANDVRLLAAQWAADGSVFAAQTIGCNPGAGTVDCIRWYQLTGLDGTPDVQQEGTLAGDGEYRFFPSLAPDAEGNLILAYSYSTSASAVGVRFTGRLSGDDPGTVARDADFKLGEAVYDNPFVGASHRWGDYTAMAVDPADPCVVWYIGEYARTRTNPTGPNWGTWIGSLSFPGCGASATAQPTATPTDPATVVPLLTATSTSTATPTETATPDPTMTTAAAPSATASATAGAPSPARLYLPAVLK